MPRRVVLVTLIALFSLGLLSVCPVFSETAKTTAKLTVDAASSKQKENKSRVNWIAVSSMATLAAVLVALFSPITWEIYRRRQAARILRQQILLQLMLLRPVVARRFVDTGLGPATYAGLDAHERTPIDAIETLFSQAHLLKADEHNELLRILVNLKAMALLSFVEATQGRSMLDLIDKGIQLFELQGFLRGKEGDIPWSETEDDSGSPKGEEPPAQETAQS